MFLFKRNSVFYVEYVDNLGRTKRMSTGKKFKQAANQFLTEFKSKLNEQPKTKSINLKEVETEYKDFLKSQYSIGYLKQFECTIKHLKLFFGDSTPLSSITTNDWSRYFTFYSKNSKATTNGFIRVIKAMMNRYVEWGYLESNPMIKIKPIKLAENNPHFITENEFQTILNTELYIIYKPIYTVLYYTGMRIGELVNLEWSHIDFDKRLINIINTKTFQTKSKKSRVIPMNNIVYDILSNTPRLKQYVFVNSLLRKYNKNHISAKFRTTIRKTTLNQKYHLHSLRSSFASQLVNKNVSIFVVSKLLGHSTVKLTERYYTHLQLDIMVDAVNMLG